MSIKGNIYQKLPLTFKMKYENNKRIKNTINKKIKFYNDKPRVYIIGESDNGNVGDLAITVTHYEMIKKIVPNDCQIIRVLYSDFWDYYLFLKKNIRQSDLITIPGGGNIGDVYTEAEVIRQTILHEFKNNEIIVFPSTVFFSKGYHSNELYKRSKKIYNNHKHLTIFAREEYSYNILKKNYFNANVYLIPDMVFQYKNYNNSVEREDKILLCLRNDTEKSITSEEQDKVYKNCHNVCKNIDYTDTFIDDIFADKDEQRIEIINKKIKEFSSAQLIITDRLHGMVLAYIAKTPCIVFANYNHKIKGVYKWIKNEKNVYYADNVDLGINKIKDMYGIVERKQLSNEPIIFDYKLLENKIENWRLQYFNEK